MTDFVLEVAGLRVDAASGDPIVDDVSFEVRAGEVLGLVGESGCGKTTTGLALLGHTRRGARLTAGSVKVAGHELVGLDDKRLRSLRGRIISYVPQDPSSALNPSIRVGAQVGDMLRVHKPDRARPEAVQHVLARVELPGDPAFQRRFPHQLSGGQQQRVAIAAALVCEPPVAVFDEPTTGLDVVTQALLLEEIDRLRRETGLALVYVSHDLAVVASIADRIAVMYAGRIVEEGPAERVLARPLHPYTRGLLASVPDHAVPRRVHGMPGVAVGVGERPAGCAFAPRCPQRIDRCDATLPLLEAVVPGHRVRCFEWRRTPALVLEPLLEPDARATSTPLLVADQLRAVYPSRAGPVVAAEDVSFSVETGESVALVGESGSGKTTIARCIVGLHAPAAGRILFDGSELRARAKQRTREARRRIQIVFQNPNESLNPRHRVRDAIGTPARVLRELSKRDAESEVVALLERVRLPARLADRYPAELSGGERQRVAIARALIARPDLVVCDEITSALDVSVQAAVLELLGELRTELGLALLFISHDLGVVATVSDRVLVLDRGLVCEEGPVGGVLRRPQASYTKRLVEAAPRLPEASAQA